MSSQKLAALLLLLPPTLGAQTLTREPSFQQPASAVAFASSSGQVEAPICDGSRLRNARRQAILGGIVMAASLPVALYGGYQTNHDPNHPMGPVARAMGISVGMVITGFVIAGTSWPHESFYEDMVGRMRTGRTTSSDVHACLLRPDARISSDSLDEWTYVTSRGTYLKSVKLTFRDSVLVGIKRAEALASLVEPSQAPAVTEIAVPVVPPVIPPPVIPPPPPPPPRRR
jgi:hypothetical protein